MLSPTKKKAKASVVRTSLNVCSVAGNFLLTKNFGTLNLGCLVQPEICLGPTSRRAQRAGRPEEEAEEEDGQ